MANIDLYKQKLVAIADAIRQKLSESDTYKLEEMPEKILSIETGSGVKLSEYDRIMVPKVLSITPYTTFSSITIVNGYSALSLSKE